MKVWLLTLAILFSWVPAQAENIILRYDWNGMQLELNRDVHGVVRIDGIGIADLVLLYNSRNHTLFAHLPWQSYVSTVPFDSYGYALPEGKLLAGEDWEPYMDEPSRFWQITLGNTTCAHMFANVKAARQSGLNISDLTRIQASLAYLIGPPSKQDPRMPNGCPPYRIPSANGEVVGLPLHIINGQGHGTIELIAIEADPDGTPHRLPMPGTGPLDAKTHVSFLKSVLPPAMRNTFEATNHHIPWRQQVRALKELLRQIQEQTRVPENANRG